MNEPNLTAFQRTKIQMEYVVPLLRDLQAQLGKDVIIDALRQRLADRVADATANVRKNIPAEKRMAGAERGFEMFGEGNTLSYEVIASDQSNRTAVDVHRCGYAELMAGMEAADLGDLLLCSDDYVATAAVNTKLDRTQTLMLGASHCNFRFEALED